MRTFAYSVFALLFGTLMATSAFSQTVPDTETGQYGETDTGQLEDQSTWGEPQAEVDQQAELDQQAAMDPAAEEAAQGEEDPAAQDQFAANQGEQNENIVRADNMLGMAVYGQDNQQIGSVKEIVIDRENGQVSSLALAVGGVLGMGEEYYLIPWDRVAFDQNRVTTKLSKNELQGLPSRRSLDNIDQSWIDEAKQQIGATGTPQ